jgi:hypothetical protein
MTRHTCGRPDLVCKIPFLWNDSLSPKMMTDTPTELRFGIPETHFESIRDRNSEIAALVKSCR